MDAAAAGFCPSGSGSAACGSWFRPSQRTECYRSCSCSHAAFLTSPCIQLAARFKITELNLSSASKNSVIYFFSCSFSVYAWRKLNLWSPTSFTFQNPKNNSGKTSNRITAASIIFKPNADAAAVIQHVTIQYVHS